MNNKQMEDKNYNDFIQESEKVYLIYEVEDNPYDTSRLIGCAMTKEKAEEICDDLRRKHEKTNTSEKFVDDAKKFNDWLWENDLTEDADYSDLVAEHFGVDQKYAEKALKYEPSEAMMFYYVPCDVVG